jgi:hypothetical protein
MSASQVKLFHSADAQALFKLWADIGDEGVSANVLGDDVALLSEGRAASAVGDSQVRSSKATETLKLLMGKHWNDVVTNESLKIFYDRIRKNLSRAYDRIPKAEENEKQKMAALLSAISVFQAQDESGLLWKTIQPFIVLAVHSEQKKSLGKDFKFSDLVKMLDALFKCTIAVSRAHDSHESLLQVGPQTRQQAQILVQRCDPLAQLSDG